LAIGLDRPSEREFFSGEYPPPKKKQNRAEKT